MSTDTLHNKKLGKQGEDLAAAYLVANGYEICARNFRAGHQELDIIASHEGMLHFLEVKTRRSVKFGFGEDAMHKKKIDRLLQGINVYLESFDKEPEWQLDLIVVEWLAKTEPRFMHYQAIGPGDGS